MKIKIVLLIFMGCIIHGTLIAQVTLPWHVNDNGGGRSTAGGFVLQASIGQPAVGTAIATGANLESGYIPGLRNISGAATTLSNSYGTGWNLLSVPCAVADSHKTILYPTAISSAFSYSNSYIQQALLQNGVGYWLKFSGPTTVPITGTTIQQESTAVTVGWNMIGPPSYPVLLSDISPIGTTVISNYFGYSSSYRIEDTLKPGYG